MTARAQAARAALKREAAAVPAAPAPSAPPPVAVSHAEVLMSDQFNGIVPTFVTEKF